MNESELLEQLDRRAAEARGALHAAVSEAPLPPLRAPRHSGRRRAPFVVLAAAAVLMVAVAFSQLTGGGGDDDAETMVAGAPETETEPVDPGDERFPDVPGARALAEVAMQERGLSLSATLLVDGSGDHILMTSVEGPDGTVSSGAGLRDVETSTAVRQDIEDGGDGLLVAGLVGPSVTSVEIVDPATGRPVEGEGPSTATIEGSDHVLFMGRVGAAWSDLPLLAVGTAADGTEVQVAF